MNKNKDRGFTLIELLIALAITGIIGVSITTLYIRNLRINTGQISVVQVQQNIRATIDYLAREIRMAGYIGNNAVTAGITTATEGRLRFTAFSEAAGAINDLDFMLNIDGSDGLGVDADGDGLLDGGINNSGTHLTVQFGGAGGFQTLAENIHAIGFAYALNDGGNIRTYTTTAGTQAILWVIPDPSGGGNWMRLDTNGDGEIDANDDTDGNRKLDLVDTTIVIDSDSSGVIDPVELSVVKAVRINLLGSSNRSAQDFVNQQTYVVGRHVLLPNDSIRRRLLTTTITCRNMGL